MNEEIKSHMQNCVDREESCLLNDDNTKLLLNCITNLQEENQKLNKIIDELEKWLKNDIKNIYRDAGYRNNIMNEVLDKLTELKKEVE